MKNRTIYAYPITEDTTVGNAGMELRDYFASKAIEGKLPSYQKGSSNADYIAKMAYELADEMMKQRKL